MADTKGDTFVLVWETVRRVPFGRVTTYGAVAAAVGNPRLSRIVGCALHVAPEDVPCHRVVNRLGELSPAFSPDGRETHRLLLEMEGVTFDGAGRVELKKWGWVPQRLDETGREVPRD